MPSLRQGLLAAVGILGLAAASPCAVPTPLPPSEDPWYTGTAGYESLPPGSVLRIRPAPGNLTSIFSASSAWNILYRTTDSQYKPTFAVTTVFVPVNPNPKALLSYQIPYDSADVDSSPSYSFYGSTADSIKNSVYGEVLDQGWFLSLPDYEGPLASFTAGVMSGHAVIDSVRAILASHRSLGLDEDALYAMWGYSGGALASEWAAELQVQYAPEMTFAGTALGGLTPNVVNVLYAINEQLAAGLGPSAILGLSSQYPDIQAKIVASLKQTGPYNATTFLSAQNMSLAESGTTFAFQDLSQYFTNGFADILNPEIEHIIFSDGMMGYHGVPQMPLFVYKAVNDEISPVADTDELVDRFCGVGANILYNRNSVGSHSEEASNEGPAAFEWLASVFNGTYSSTYQALGCTTVNVTVNISEEAT